MKELLATKPQKNSEFKYMLLSRMEMDCHAYIYNPLHPHHLWSGSPEKHIEDMKLLWNDFSEGAKPQWLTYKQILEFEAKFKEIAED